MSGTTDYDWDRVGQDPKLGGFLLGWVGQHIVRALHSAVVGDNESLLQVAESDAQLLLGLCRVILKHTDDSGQSDHSGPVNELRTMFDDRAWWVAPGTVTDRLSEQIAQEYDEYCEQAAARGEIAPLLQIDSAAEYRLARGPNLATDKAILEVSTLARCRDAAVFGARAAAGIVDDTAANDEIDALQRDAITLGLAHRVDFCAYDPSDPPPTLLEIILLSNKLSMPDEAALKQLITISHGVAEVPHGEGSSTELSATSSMKTLDGSQIQPVFVSINQDGSECSEPHVSETMCASSMSSFQTICTTTVSADTHPKVVNPPSECHCRAWLSARWLIIHESRLFKSTSICPKAAYDNLKSEQSRCPVYADPPRQLPKFNAWRQYCFRCQSYIDSLDENIKIKIDRMIVGTIQIEKYEDAKEAFIKLEIELASYLSM